MFQFIFETAFLISSYMLLLSIAPGLLPIGKFFWPLIFSFATLNYFCRIHLKIPFNWKLLHFSKDFYAFRDSIRSLQIKISALWILPIFVISFWALVPNATLWLPIWTISLLLIQPKSKENHTPTPYTWLFKSEKSQPIHSDYPLLRKTLSFEGEKRFEKTCGENPHVIFIFLESFRAKNIGAIGSRATNSPHFDALAKQGALFTQFYANGLQTFRAMISSFFGIPAHLETMSLKPFSKIPMIGLPTILKQAGYECAHFQGNCSTFDWTYPFLQKAGFEKIFGEEHFPRAKKTSWGLLDEELFLEAYNFLSEQQKPTFLSLFSITNHHPWIFDQVSKDYSQEERFEQTFAYTDRCLGSFIENLKKSKIFENSLIFITADHGYEFGPSMIQNNLSQDNIHIPLLITGVTPTTVTTPTSHVDLLPTVLDLLDLKAHHHSVGNSLRRNVPSSVFISMPRENKTLGKINNHEKILLGKKETKINLETNKESKVTKEEKEEIFSYFNAVEELYDEKRWVDQELQKITFELKAPIEAKDDWLEIQKTLSPILDLSSTFLSDSGFAKMQKEQQKILHELNISHSASLTDESLKWIHKNCPNLSIFHAANCPQISEDGLEAIIKIPSLRYLNLEGLPISTFPLQLPTDLSALHLKDCSDLCGEEFIKISENVPKLIYLAASLRSVKDPFIKKMYFQHLNYLWLEHGESIQSESFNQFLAKHPNLQILIIENFPHLINLDLTKHTRLQSIKIANCPRLATPILTGLEQLKEVSLVQCPKAKNIENLPKDCKLHTTS